MKNYLPLKVKTTGIFFNASCDMKLKNCKATSDTGIVTKVFIDQDTDDEPSYVCNHCLNLLVKNGNWNVPGVFVNGINKN